MPIVFRYIAKNTAQFVCGVLFVFVFVIFMAQFSRIFTYAMSYGADMFWVMSVMLYMLPDILVLSLPMAFQIGILMTLTSMSQTGEVMALRAAGFSFMEIARPILIFALLLSVLMVYLSGWLSPKGRLRVEEEKEAVASKISKVSIEPKTFVDLGDWDIFAETVDKKNNTLGAVHLSRKKDKSALSTKVNAAEGKIDIGRSSVSLNLFKGQMQRVDALDSRKIITAEFDKYNIYIPLTQKSGKTRSLKDTELTTPQLIAALRAGVLSAGQAANFRPEPLQRLAMALAPLIFFFLSCPVAFVTDKKAGRAGAMIFSIVFIFAYLGLATVGGTIGKKAALLPLAYGAPLLPVVIGAVVALWLWRKKLSD